MMENSILAQLVAQYPVHIPLNKAAPLLGVSPRQLSRLIADGRKPFSSLGANIGTEQRYVRVYTTRLVRYLSGEDISEAN